MGLRHRLTFQLQKLSLTMVFKPFSCSVDSLEQTAMDFLVRMTDVKYSTLPKKYSLDCVSIFYNLLNIPSLELLSRSCVNIHTLLNVPSLEMCSRLCVNINTLLNIPSLEMWSRLCVNIYTLLNVPSLEMWSRLCLTNGSLLCLTDVQIRRLRPDRHG